MKKHISLLSLLVIILAIFWGFYDLSPARVTTAKKPTDFSIENALTHLKAISEKTHYVGSSGHKEVQNYLVKELEKMGLNPSIQYQAVVNKKWYAGTTTENIIARIKGSETGKALMLLSHYDSNPHSSKGASDAGSGVVTILESLRAFLAKNRQPKNDIIILISDAEELGLLGAKAFVNHHPWAKDVGLVLNFEARGSGGPSYMLMETNGKNQKLISEFVKSNPINPAANSLMYSIYKKLPNDTDLTVFREEGNIDGFNFAFIGDHFDYHTAQDSYERLDKKTLQHHADYAMTSLNYFAFSDISSFQSNKDYVYVNFPILKLIYYPFSWAVPLLIFSFVVFLILVFFGLGLNRLNLKSILQGFIPAFLSIVVGSGVSFLLWKLLLIIHPAYTDILHGFTYNGYWYIATFAFLTVGLMFFIYKPFVKKENKLSLFIAPIFIWFLINLFILDEYKGASFFIIPVIIALLILGSETFKKYGKERTFYYSILSIPTVYIFAPMIEMFPVGLGLKTLFISAIFIALLFGMLLPIFIEKGVKTGIAKLSISFAVLFFIIASWKSGFNSESKKPNSLVYVKNIENNVALWGTYNNVLDDYTKQKLGDNPKKGGVTDAETKNKYNTRFRFYKEAENYSIQNSIISIFKDSITQNKREITILISPQRKVNKIELSVRDSLSFQSLTANGALVNDGKSYKIKRGTFLIYHMGNSDSNLTLKMILNNSEKPTIMINEISYDLLQNSLFNIQPRTNEMMPMPFVTNDAIMCTQKLQL